MRPNQAYKFLHSKGNYKQHEKTTLRMGKNNSTLNNWQRINFKNIQTACVVPHQKIQSKNGQKI